MAIQLGQERTSTPSVKLRSIGDKVVVAVIDVKEVPWLEYGTNEPKIGKDGKARTQERLTALVVSGNGVVGDTDGERPVKPGEVVSIYLSGHNRWEFIEAKKALGRPLSVGDVLQWKYDRDEKSSAGNDKKVRTCALRPPKDTEAAQVAECERLYHQLRTEGISLDQRPTGDNDPF